jgi:hypothetical protein
VDITIPLLDEMQIVRYGIQVKRACLSCPSTGNVDNATLHCCVVIRWAWRQVGKGISKNVISHLQKYTAVLLTVVALNSGHNYSLYTSFWTYLQRWGSDNRETDQVSVVSWAVNTPIHTRKTILTKIPLSASAVFGRYVHVSLHDPMLQYCSHRRASIIFPLLLLRTIDLSHSECRNAVGSRRWIINIAPIIGEYVTMALRANSGAFRDYIVVTEPTVVKSCANSCVRRCEGRNWGALCQVATSSPSFPLTTHDPVFQLQMTREHLTVLRRNVLQIQKSLAALLFTSKSHNNWRTC